MPNLSPTPPVSISCIAEVFCRFWSIKIWSAGCTKMVTVVNKTRKLIKTNESSRNQALILRGFVKIQHRCKVMQMTAKIAQW